MAYGLKACSCHPLIALIYTLTRNDIRVQHYQHQHYLFTSFEYQLIPQVSNTLMYKIFFIDPV